MILLKLKAVHIAHLGKIRHWEGLKIAKEGDCYWLSGLSEGQASALEVVTIPTIEVFVVKEGLLFPHGAVLPIAKAPQLLWSPVVDAIPLEFPDNNFNFFHTDEQIVMKLVPSDREQATYGVRVSLELLASFLERVPAVRLKELFWCLMGEKEALILGLPVPSIAGKSYWRLGNALIPSGYHYEYPLLANLLEVKLQVGNEAWLYWGNTAEYVVIPKADFIPLDRRSFHLSRRYT